MSICLNPGHPEYPYSDNLDKAQYLIGVDFEYIISDISCHVESGESDS